MLRLVRDEHGHVWPDLLAKAPGRGAYLCWKKACIGGLRDRHLGAGWKGKAVAAAEAGAVRGRLAVALLRLIRQYVHRRRASLEIGRDAVMRRLHDPKPVLVLLAKDAGEVLGRDIAGACRQREQAGRPTRVLPFTDKSTMGSLVGRTMVAVMATDDTPATERLRQCCEWYACLDGNGVE